MTRQRFDNHSTEFGLWLREQKEIDSKLGFVATNIDYIWHNYNYKQWMLIEEKRYFSEMRYAQSKMLQMMHTAANQHPQYRGFYFIQFQYTNPEDGLIRVNGHDFTKEKLMRLLQFDEDVLSEIENTQRAWVMKYRPKIQQMEAA